ncbi:MAG: hypothetical protein N4A48_06405 [Tepidibacter sp.]|jgi:hypothetical protein|uniref:hypothetical protein n=1 Tax=Tepidibacter sp. TaxID=2529387 RepID=UPI00260157E4|nr:hypothetical protein [Tepidibacter sp.]MCT4508382.1 hypothetical protein [Tepidibacter sp.]
MTCGTHEDKKIYNNDVNTRPTGPCCKANSSCCTPERYDPKKITAECIFVEKVYDSKIIKKELDLVISERFDPGFPTEGIVGFDDVSVSCSSKGLKVIPKTISVNGITEFPPPIPGPGGIEQLDLSFIDTSECDERRRHVGTPIIIEQDIEVCGFARITISGKALFTNGKCREFTSTFDVPVDNSLTGFAQLCIPSTEAAFPPSLAEFCAALCKVILPAGTRSLSVVDGDIQVYAALVICIKCEKKVKLPVQLCVLSTGFCEPEEQSGLCGVDFPDLFPRQIDRKEMCDSHGCDC